MNERIGLNSLKCLGGLMIKEKDKDLIDTVIKTGFNKILSEVCFPLKWYTYLNVYLIYI